MSTGVGIVSSPAARSGSAASATLVDGSAPSPAAHRFDQQEQCQKLRRVRLRRRDRPLVPGRNVDVEFGRVGQG